MSLSPEDLQAISGLLDELRRDMNSQHDEIMNRFEETDLLIHNVQGEQLRIRADFLDLRNEVRTVYRRLQIHLDHHGEVA